MAESLSFCILTFSTLVRPNHEIPLDDHTRGIAGPDRDRRLNVEIAACNLLPGLVQAVCAAAPQRRHDGAVVVGGAKFGADAEHSRERGCHDQPSPMVIDFNDSAIVTAL